MEIITKNLCNLVGPYMLLNLKGSVEKENDNHNKEQYFSAVP